ncbi:10999_t:CDS:1, partial [Acaulospora morrowiae]
HSHFLRPPSHKISAGAQMTHVGNSLGGLMFKVIYLPSNADPVLILQDTGNLSIGCLILKPLADLAIVGLVGWKSGGKQDYVKILLIESCFQKGNKPDQQRVKDWKKT